MSFQDTDIKSTPEEQAKHLAAIGVMPSPVVPDLRKVTIAELQEEVIFLRLFVASQMIGFKELAIKLNEVECKLNIVEGKVVRLETPPSTDIVYAGEAERAEYQNIMETDVAKEMAEEPQFVSSLSRMDELAKEEYNPFGPSLDREN